MKNIIYINAIFYLKIKMNEVSDDKHYEKCLLMKVQNIPKLKQIFKNLNDSKLLKIIIIKI